jgi:transforming growth factor-beta-induced protein
MKTTIKRKAIMLIGLFTLMFTVGSCTDESILETEPLVEEIVFEESKIISFDEIEKLTQNIIEGELVDEEAENKLTSAESKSRAISIERRRFDFFGEVTSGSDNGLEINGELQLKFTLFHASFAIIRGDLVFPDGSKAKVRGAWISDGYVYLFIRLANGYINGYGKADEDGNIEGRFKLYNRNGRSIGNWSADLTSVTKPNQTIVDIALADNRFTKLVDALSAADLVGALQGEGPFTVFAPTNNAFAALDALPEGDALKEVLLYHVVSGKYRTQKLLKKEMVETLQGEKIRISLNENNEIVINDTVKLVQANIRAKNGIIHVLSGVLIPPLPNIVETAQSAGLNILVDAAIQAGLVDALTAAGDKTVLAPTDAAFIAFLADKGFNSLSEVPNEVLEQILLNHVIAGSNITSSALAGSTGYVSTLADGANSAKLSLYYDGTSGVTFNGYSNVAIPDVETSNGIVHVVDAVIDLPSIVDHVVANSGFSSLVAALGAADGDLVSVLSGAGPFTVLAPDDNAFATFLDGADLGDVPTDALSQVLLNHVIGGAISSTDLVGLGNGYTNSSATGAGNNPMSIYFNTDNGVVFNGISEVMTADVVGTNGIIHAVNTVIGLPTVVTFAVADPTFSTLVTALTELTPTTDFVSVLSTADGTDPAPFTVFAPTNAAFADLAAIPGETVLTEVLLHHVVGGLNIQSGDLQVGDNTAPTLQGQNITVVVPGSGDNIANITDGAGSTDSGIIAVDVQASNGVIHVINKVLIPEL